MATAGPFSATAAPAGLGNPFLAQELGSERPQGSSWGRGGSWGRRSSRDGETVFSWANPTSQQPSNATEARPLQATSRLAALPLLGSAGSSGLAPSAPVMTPIDLKHRSELAALHPVGLDEPGAPPVALGATVAGPGGQPLVAAAGKVDPYYLTGPGAPSAAPPAAPEADDPLLDGSLVAAAQVIEEVRLERISAGATEK